MNKKLPGIIKIITGIILVVSLAACATVGPARKVYSRAEFVAKISDYFAWPHPTEYNDIWKVPLKQFNDVKPTDAFSKQIDVAYEEMIIEADADGNFRPDAPLSREDAAVIIAKAFKVPEAGTDVLAAFSDVDKIKPEARPFVNALVSAGYMAGKSAKVFGPDTLLGEAEVDAIFDAITTAAVTPVQALPKTNAVAPRRYVKLYSPTPGATIHFTTDGSTPTTTSEVYTVATHGHINEMLSNAQLPERDVVYKAIAVKDGMTPSPVQTFTWHLYRPATAEFQHLQIMEKTDTSPAVYRISSDAESVRAMAWYIEGQYMVICFDALQTPSNISDLKAYIDANIATKPNYVVVGHEHGDHDMQAPNFMSANMEVYLNERGWAAVGAASGPFPAVFPDPADQARIKNVEEGDVFHLGGCDLYVYAMPGHANGNIVLQDKENGLIFSSDIYGCTRAGSADNVAIQGVRADLMLSLAQQTYSNYMKDDGKVVGLFTGHDETPLGDANLKLFEAAFQQVIDKGEAGCSATLRGKNDAPNSRTTIIGDMWKDGTNWIAIKLPGIMGDASEYLTSSPINYNGKDGYLKYSVLSNIEFKGASLVGTTLQWAPAPKPFPWAGGTKSVDYALQNKFNPWVYDYKVMVPASSDSVTVIPTSMSTKVKSIAIDGKEVAYRSSNKVAVSNGSVMKIRIIAPDGVTTSEYTFTFSKNS